MHAVSLLLPCLAYIGLSSRVRLVPQKADVEGGAARVLASYMLAVNSAPAGMRQGFASAAAGQVRSKPLVARLASRQRANWQMVRKGSEHSVTLFKRPSRSRSRPPKMNFFENLFGGAKKEKTPVVETEPDTEPEPVVPARKPPKTSTRRSKEVGKLRALGGSPTEKALQVNLDTGTYGSFAEIGAGQEVSRTFLQAGAAAGTVAKSLSAYDMQMSDALYGRAKRYVTKERCIQMMDGEFKDLEEYVREGKAAWGGRSTEVRFFSFAASLAAKAFMSDRECEGWVGLTYQHEAGAKKSTIVMHVRMGDPTATLQGEAIGILGTNLIYLATNTNDPYVITSFLQDGIDEGRLEIDYLDFSGPGFPEGSVDPRIIAFRQVQYGLSPSVMLEFDAKVGKFTQSVPNDALYKTPVIVQRSRFLPVTKTHEELMASAKRQVLAQGSEFGRDPKCINQLQIDDLLLPKSVKNVKVRSAIIDLFLAADTDDDGFLTADELRGVLRENTQLSDAEIEKDINSIAELKRDGFARIDSLAVLSDIGPASEGFLDRLEMLETLKNPVMISSIEQDHKLAQYLARYTNEQVTVAIGGGNYSIQRGLYNKAKYKDLNGGLLEAFGRLFAKKVKILEYPTIDADGKISPGSKPSGADLLLHNYLMEEGHLVPIAEEHLSPAAKDASLNEAIRVAPKVILTSIKDGTDEWEKYVPEEVAKVARSKAWFSQVQEGKDAPVADFYDLLTKINT
jgi:hypothetical protein